MKIADIVLEQNIEEISATDVAQGVGKAVGTGVRGVKAVGSGIKKTANTIGTLGKAFKQGYRSGKTGTPLNTKGTTNLNDIMSKIKQLPKPAKISLLSKLS